MTDSDPLKPGPNIVLAYRPRKLDPHDYEQIAQRIHALAPDVNVMIVPDEITSPDVYALLSERPTLVFCPSRLQNFAPKRGTVFCGRFLPKSEQLRMMAKAGVRVPQWAFLQPGVRYNETEWGKFVIVKPNAFGASTKGRGVELVRTASLQYLPPIFYAASHPGSKGDMLVQKLIDTGEFSEDYRVVTMFGRPLYALKRRSLVPRENLDETGADRTAKGIVSNAASGPREAHFSYEEDVLKFAAKVYSAIPQVPFQAIDVRREIGTGRLYCLEINPGGNTWNFSSRRAREIPTIDGIRREDQFGAWEIAARALVEQARLYAR